MACVFVLRQWVIGTYSGSGYPFVFWGSCFWCVCAGMPKSTGYSKSQRIHSKHIHIHMLNA